MLHQATWYIIALIHKEPGSAYGVSFPDVPGVTTAADSIEEVMARAVEVLAFAADDCRDLRQEETSFAATRRWRTA